VVANGEIALSGGHSFPAGANFEISASRPADNAAPAGPDAWTVAAANPVGGTGSATYTVYAVCLDT
jgi:hypothetical protein